MGNNCGWCESGHVNITKQSVYWELPEGTRAIEITDTPSIYCNDCHMIYQNDEMVKNIEDQLFLINRKQLSDVISYKDLMEMERILKRNYFDF
ncbi:YokU family protein [Cytobacillus gottheilii]|uniref:YokU family protein n=1 Tax=Cytobacillus gottheilii TaxID=859144 RepID=A0ABX8F7E5_9BACI|nr:YokU family protein [Cytobacillus gottheilii]QVY60045.1 YokU family protein [Cytobacillus gottheilii]